MVLAVISEIESGFERNGCFYSRDEATRLRQAA
jgi:hypothetical protein